jgi:hypothetical protein
MAWIRATGFAATVLLLAAPPAAAQDSPRRQELAATTADMFDKLGMLGETLGIDTPPFPTDVMSQALEAALPVLPAGDGRDWDTTVAFDFTSDVSTGALEPDEGGRTVLTDARACKVESPTGEVVHFVRFTRVAVRGYRCITLAESNGVWGVQSRTFAEGPDRRLTAYYGMAMAIDGDPTESRRRVEERLDQNVVLAGTLAEYALEMFLASDAPAREADEDLAARTARLTERLSDVLAAVQAP